MILLSLAQSASQFQTRLFQTAVDPFTDHIVCRVTKISPARVARGLQSTNTPVSSLGPLERVCPDCIVYIDQSKSTGNVFTNSKIKIAFNLLHGSWSEFRIVLAVLIAKFAEVFLFLPDHFKVMTSSLKWKAWDKILQVKQLSHESSVWPYFCRLLASFEHCGGGLLGVNCIISDAEQVKENFACPPNSSSFGLLIKQIWGGRVKLVKRGSHKQQRVNYYENLQRKSPCNTSLVDLRSQIQQISPLKNGWHLLLDQGEDLSLICHESWSFQNQRVITEVKVRSKNGLNSISLHSHGCQTDITDLFKLDYLKNQHSSIELILSIVNSSPLCRGITVTEVLHTTLPTKVAITFD